MLWATIRYVNRIKKTSNPNQFLVGPNKKMKKIKIKKWRISAVFLGFLDFFKIIFEFLMDFLKV